MSKMEDLKTESVEKLKTVDQELSKAIYDLKCELRLARKLDKPHLLRKNKKDRARVLTALQQKG